MAASPYWGQLPGPKIVHHRQPEDADHPTSDALTRNPTSPINNHSLDHDHNHNRLSAPSPDTTSFSSDHDPKKHAPLNGPATHLARSASATSSAANARPPPSAAPQRRRSNRLQKSPRQLAKMNPQYAQNENRTSVQSAMTNSTWSSLPTPTFPTGLAPRPPSYNKKHQAAQTSPSSSAQPHHDDGDTDMATYDQPNLPRQPYDDGDYYESHPQTAATHDAPRGPPTSYRDPQPQGAYAAGGAASSQQDDYSSHYNTQRSSSGYQDDAPRRPSDTGVAFAANPQPSSAVPMNVTTDTARRKPYANDRSPLQKLELTLGSYTKEEKRARVEAAERRARERAARKAGLPPASHGPAIQQAPQQDRRVVSAPLNAQSYPDQEPQSAPAPPRARQASAIHPPAQPMQHSQPAQHKPQQQYDLEQPAEILRQPGSQRAYAPAQPPSGPDPHEAVAVATQEEKHRADHESGIPKRNLSFRDRAAHDHDELPGPPTPQEPIYQAQPQASRSGGLSLTRSGSNKLRKDPPGDPWFHRRMEAERQMPTVSQRQQPEHPRQIPRRSLDKQLPPNPPQSHDYDDESPQRSGRGATGAGAAAAAAALNNRRYEGESDSPVQSMTEEKYMPTKTRRKSLSHWGYEASNGDPLQEEHDEDDDRSMDSSAEHQQALGAYGRPDQMSPGAGLYQPPTWLNEWEKATVGTLSGSLLDVEMDLDPEPEQDKNKAWWEGGGTRSRANSSATRARKAEAYDGEYDTTNPTRFKPALRLECGPLIRYNGIRQERVTSRASSLTTKEREMWRGSIMIVTKDKESSYEIAPTLRLFLQDMELLPPPPHKVNGELPPEYVDPIAGHPKLGRSGETLYVRPVEELLEGKDLSRDETDNGLFESVSTASEATSNQSADMSFASRKSRGGLDGEKVQKYKDVRGFRLHAEQGCTFWRFNIEIELGEKQQRIAYRINRGPAMAFWVPRQGTTMNMMFYSCNGFSLAANPDDFSGPDPMWRDVLNNHQSQPFHAMIGGGDQIYNDCVADQTDFFGDWLDIKNVQHKQDAPFTPEMQDELEEFYFRRYCSWFSTGLFGLATSQIPMVNMYDDHDIFDGYGSYADKEMRSPVLKGLGAVAFKYYMLFQQQSIIPETGKTEPSMIMGTKPGPYIGELSRSLYMSMGAKVSLLAVDTRTERMEDEVISSMTWESIMNRLYAEVRKGQVEHLLVLLGVPIAYPRLVWLENILTSRLLDPIKALGKTGMLGKQLNKLDGNPEILDDLNDHWTAKSHKKERSLVIEDLQDLAIDKSLRITILSGDVHLAAVGQFFSNPKLGLAKHKDPRYMPNVISSAIANSPPPNWLADALNKRNKVHHFDKQTDESMIPLFGRGVDGKSRNNKTLLPARNWCSIKVWNPGMTPPPTPPPEEGGSEDRSVSPPPNEGGFKGLVRRLSRSRSQSGRPEVRQDSVRGPKPPITGGGAGGLLRRLSRSGSKSKNDKPKLQRTMSLDSQQPQQPPKESFLGSLKRRLSQSKQRPDDGGINGQWGEDEYDDDNYYDDEQPWYNSARNQGYTATAYGVHGQQTQPPGQHQHQAQHQMHHQGHHQAHHHQSHPYQSQQSRQPQGRRDYFDDDDDDSEDGYRPSGLRGGGLEDAEYQEGDEEYFTARPNRRGQPHYPPQASQNYHSQSQRRPSQDQYHSRQSMDNYPPPPAARPSQDLQDPPTRPFHRTPTGLSTKQKRNAEQYTVDVEGGLDISLNVEVNPKDPTGITTPYRLLVPKLFYEYTPGEDDLSLGERGGQGEKKRGGGFKRLLSFRRKEREEQDWSDEEGEY